jgi:hypothetical protein
MQKCGITKLINITYKMFMNCVLSLSRTDYLAQDSLLLNFSTHALSFGIFSWASKIGYLLKVLFCQRFCPWWANCKMTMPEHARYLKLPLGGGGGHKHKNRCHKSYKMSTSEHTTFDCRYVIVQSLWNAKIYIFGKEKDALKNKKKNLRLHGLSPQVNYTDRVTATCWRS